MPEWTWIVGGLVGLVAIALAIGALLPRQHVASRSVGISQAPETVFAVLDAIADFPTWSRDVKKVEILAGEDGLELVRQTLASGATRKIQTILREPPAKLVRELVGGHRSIRGRWIYEVFPEREGCRVVLREEADLENPIVRLIAGVLARTAFADRHLEDLAQRFSESAVVE